MKNQRIDIDTNADNPRSLIQHRLQEAIDELRADVARVELWASALMTFAEPIPDYTPSKRLAFDRTRATAGNHFNSAGNQPANGAAKPAQQA